MLTPPSYHGTSASVTAAMTAAVPADIAHQQARVLPSQGSDSMIDDRSVEGNDHRYQNLPPIYMPTKQEIIGRHSK